MCAGPPITGIVAIIAGCGTITKLEPAVAIDQAAREVRITSSGPANGLVIKISEKNAIQVRLGGPEMLASVETLKILAAAFLQTCDVVLETVPEAAQDLPTAVTALRTACLWAVMGATKQRA